MRGGIKMNRKYQERIDYWKLLSVINAVDPMNILPNDNRQEYYTEVCLILEYLEKNEDITTEKLEKELKEVFQQMFSIDLSEIDLYFLTNKINELLLK
jgi:hypothetical protein